MKFSKDKKIELFKLMASKTIMEVGKIYEFEKYYKSPGTIRSAVYKVYNEVKNNPEEFGITEEAYNLVVDSVAMRSISGRRKDELTGKVKMDVSNATIKELTLDNRDKIARLLSKKLDMISVKDLKAMKISEFTNPYGMLFDKGQILQGQATENIAVLSKIEDGLSSKDLLDALLNQREVTVSSNQK